MRRLYCNYGNTSVAVWWLTGTMQYLIVEKLQNMMILHQIDELQSRFKFVILRVKNTVFVLTLSF